MTAPQDTGIFKDTSAFKDIGIIDLMLAIPGEHSDNMYEFMKPLLMDEQSRNMFKMPAQYMFKDIPQTGEQDDYIAYTLAEMDKYGIEKAMLGVDERPIWFAK